MSGLLICTIAIVGLILLWIIKDFGHILYLQHYEQKRLAKLREAFCEFNAKSIPIYVNTKGHICFYDDNKNKVPFTEDENIELTLCPLSSQSHVPNKGYAVEIERYCDAKDGLRGKEHKIIFMLAPENGAITIWKVAFISGDSLILEHQVMGHLLFPKTMYFALNVGQEIHLRQNVRRVDGEYLLTYEFCSC